MKNSAWILAGLAFVAGIVCFFLSRPGELLDELKQKSVQLVIPTEDTLKEVQKNRKDLDFLFDKQKKRFQEKGVLILEAYRNQDSAFRQVLWPSSRSNFEKRLAEGQILVGHSQLSEAIKKSNERDPLSNFHNLVEQENSFLKGSDGSWRTGKMALSCIDEVIRMAFAVQKKYPQKIFEFEDFDFSSFMSENQKEGKSQDPYYYYPFSFTLHIHPDIQFDLVEMFSDPESSILNVSFSGHMITSSPYIPSLHEISLPPESWLERRGEDFGLLEEEEKFEFARKWLQEQGVPEEDLPPMDDADSYDTWKKEASGNLSLQSLLQSEALRPEMPVKITINCRLWEVNSESPVFAAP